MSKREKRPTMPEVFRPVEAASWAIYNAEDTVRYLREARERATDAVLAAMTGRDRAEVRQWAGACTPTNCGAGEYQAARVVLDRMRLVPAATSTPESAGA